VKNSSTRHISRTISIHIAPENLQVKNEAKEQAQNENANNA